MQDTTVQHFILRLRLQKGGILAGHYGTTFYTEAKVAKGGTYLQDTTVQHFILRLRLQKGGAYLQDTTVQHFILRLRLQKWGHTCRILRYNILY